MPEITVELSEDTYDRLEDTSEFHEISIEQAARRAIRIWNEKPHSEDEIDEALEGGRSFGSIPDAGPPLGDEEESG
jgi:hypothetical protein